MMTKGNKDEVVLLLDGDMILFTAVSAARQLVDWDSDGQVITDTVDVNEARNIFTREIEKKVKECENATGGIVKKTILCLTGPGNFRRDVLPAYKGGRGVKPPGYRKMQDWVMRQEGYSVYLKDGLEADDCLGILLTHPKMYKGFVKVLWSGDKDLMQIPGKHLQDGKIVEVSEYDGEVLFYKQTCTGDITDGYKGIPSFGPMAWVSLINKAKEEDECDQPSLCTIFRLVKEAYLKKGSNLEELLVQARCARILRYDDYDYEKKEVILWEPK